MLSTVIREASRAHARRRGGDASLTGVSLYGRSYGPWWLFIPTGLVGAVAAAVGGRLWRRVAVKRNCRVWTIDRIKTQVQY